MLCYNSIKQGGTPKNRKGEIIMTTNELARLSTVALTHKYASEFIDDIGWEDWMKEYCEDPESPTEDEIARIDEELKRIWKEA